MSTDRIRELLDELNREIDNMPELDQKLRNEFTRLHAGLDDALDPETDAAVGSMLDDAIALEARFAATHPTAEKIVRELINSLSRIGI